MQKVAIIGAGISGLSMAHLLKDRYEVTVYEKEQSPGGLIRCKNVNGNLFHICGGHVFNSKYQDVLDWFWKFFDKENEFTLTDRNSVVFLDADTSIPYPIENHMYMMDKDVQMSFIQDLLHISASGDDSKNAVDFEDFLQRRFGGTLYHMYFKPYNTKVWRRDLSTVPLKWLEGKLPMPTVEEMIFNNFNHIEEKKFVHSRFWYEKKGGSQFVVDRLSEGLNIVCEKEISHIGMENGMWNVQNHLYDKVVYCGNIKQIPSLLRSIDLKGYVKEIESLESHGTTAVFCQIDKNPYSWIYLPNDQYESHRIICTGNFSETNNVFTDSITGTIEFTDEISKVSILDNLSRIPLHPKYLDHHYSKYTYPIQNADTRDMIKALKALLSSEKFFMTGRFADWEYYNMDVAIKAAMRTNAAIG